MSTALCRQPPIGHLWRHVTKHLYLVNFVNYLFPPTTTPIISQPQSLTRSIQHARHSPSQPLPQYHPYGTGVPPRRKRPLPTPATIHHGPAACKPLPCWRLVHSRTWHPLRVPTSAAFTNPAPRNSNKVAFQASTSIRSTADSRCWTRPLSPSKLKTRIMQLIPRTLTYVAYFLWWCRWRSRLYF